MLLQEKIRSDLKEFLKTGKSFEAGVLRMLIASFQNKEIEKKGKGEEPLLSEEETVDILMRESKKRKEAGETYSKAGRNDLSEKENKEVEIIKSYLPEQISTQEIEKAVDEIIKNIGASSQKDFGKVMAETMKGLRGKAEASLISGIIKNKLGG